MQNVPHKWPDLIQKLEQYTPALKVTKVIWEFPLKDGSSLYRWGEQGKSLRKFYRFCVER